MSLCMSLEVIKKFEFYDLKLEIYRMCQNAFLILWSLTCHMKI